MFSFFGCQSNDKKSPEQIDPNASPALNNQAGAWAPLTAQVIDYDGNSSLACRPGESIYSIFLKTGMVIDQKQAIISADCDETIPKIKFRCESNNNFWQIKAAVEGTDEATGNMGIYQNKKDCDGYVQALQNKRK